MGLITPPIRAGHASSGAGRIRTHPSSWHGPWRGQVIPVLRSRLHLAAEGPPSEPRAGFAAEKPTHKRPPPAQTIGGRDPKRQPSLDTSI